MTLPSRFSLDPDAFHKADERLRRDELRDEWPLLHGDGLPQPFKKLAVHFETPMLDKLYRALVQDPPPDCECPSCFWAGRWEDTHEEITYRRKRYEDGPEERIDICPKCGNGVVEVNKAEI